MRLHTAQRFTCSQCARCCHRFDVIVTGAEIDLYRTRNAAAWFSGVDGDPFEPIPGAPGLQRIRKRADGACGFLSDDNRCRIHSELGAAKKPLTCRMFPYSFHSAADGVVVTASFGCPTIVANEGRSTAESGNELESLHKEWAATNASKPAALQLAKGRSMDTRTLFLLRKNLAAMLERDRDDIGAGVRRIAAALDDLMRSRVLALADQDFAEYVALTVPHAAAQPSAPPARDPGAVARLLQYGFLYTVAAIRNGIEHRGRSAAALRANRIQLLLHFHGVAPGLDRVNVTALKRRPVDINDPQIRPIVFHYLRSTIETLGASSRPIVDELSVAASYLNAARSLAAMNADAAGKDPDQALFIEAVTEASDVSHAPNSILGWVLVHFGGGSDALWVLGAP